MKHLARKKLYDFNREQSTMTTISQHATPHADFQFSLRTLFELVTICAMLAALSPGIGVPASVLLMLMMLALAFRRGLLALLILATAMFVPDITWQFTAMSGESMNPIGAILLIILTAAALTGWFAIRRHLTITRHADSPRLR